MARQGQKRSREEESIQRIGKTKSDFYGSSGQARVILSYISRVERRTVRVVDQQVGLEPPEVDRFSYRCAYWLIDRDYE
jgi:hypothetical protein